MTVNHAEDGTTLEPTALPKRRRRRISPLAWAIPAVVLASVIAWIGALGRVVEAVF